MGRRKIEIKPIKDDRNRSVTFLKRKGGLFKKAYELSVLCSVDVAVIIFGQNRKLYEFSSGDIHETLGRHQYYASAHEHKGPADFQDKDGGDDDDDDMDPSGSPGPDENAGPQNGVNYSHQAAMHHMRHGSQPTNTPPMPNGAFGPRMQSAEPQPMSRPDSRNQHPNFTPPNHAQMRAAQQQYAYQQNAAYLQARQNMQGHPHQGTPPMHHPPQMPPGQMPPGMPMPRAGHTYPLPVGGPPQSQMQQMYLEEQRRQSMPPFSQHDRAQSVPAFRQSPPQMSRPFESPPMPGSPKLAPNVGPRPHNSIYTPVGDDSSMLAQHWASAPTSQPAVAATSAPPNSNMQPTAPGSNEPKSDEPPQGQFNRPDSRSRMQKTPQAAQDATFTPSQPARVNSLDAKRPRLAIQIPNTASSDEASGSGAITNTTPEQSRNSDQTNSKSPARPGTQKANNEHARNGSIVLPPPSPSQPTSANPTLSAGATGPSNPFARPPPPSQLNTGLLTAPSTNKEGAGDSNNNNNNISTPISALPSRFMSNDGLLPSPSAFYPEWGLGLVSAGGMSSGMGNSLQSPGGLLMWQPTPIREGSGHQWPVPSKPEPSSSLNPTAGGSNAPGSDDERKRKPDVITPVEPGDVKRNK